MLNLLLNESNPIESRSIKGYISLWKERLLRGLNEPESVECENNLDKVRIKKIRKDFNEFRNRFLKPKI